MGIISVISNIVPAAVADICRLWFDGKPRLAAARSAKYHCLSRALFADTNPVPVKAALAMMGLCREEFRLPLVSPCDEVRERIRLCMKDLKLIAEV